jgi:hypothetical protein
VDDPKTREKVLLRDPEQAAARLRATRTALLAVDSWDAAGVERALTRALARLDVKPGEMRKLAA